MWRRLGFGRVEATRSRSSPTRPPGGVRGDHPGLPGHPAGEGVDFEQSYAASGEQSRAVESGLAADVVAFSLEPGHHPADRRRHGGHRLEQGAVQGDGHGLGRVAFVVRERRTSRPGTTLREGIEVITPNPFTLGGAVEHHGRLQRSSSSASPRTRPSVPEGPLRQHVPVQDKSAREALATFVAGKGDVMLGVRERGDLRQGRRAADRVCRARPDDLDREPGRGDQHVEEQGRAQEFVDFLYTPRRSGSSARRISPGCRGCPRRVRLPDAAEPLHDRRSRGLAGRDPLLRPRRASSWTSKTSWGAD